MYKFSPIKIEEVIRISGWIDFKENKFIYMKPYLENHKVNKDLKGPNCCDGFSVYDNKGNLFGLFEYYFNNKIMEIGLVINPEFRGKGLGKDFLLEGIEFGKTYYKYEGEYIGAEIDIDNITSKKLFEKAGFTKTGEIINKKGMLTTLEYRKEMI